MFRTILIVSSAVISAPQLMGSIPKFQGTAHEVVIDLQEQSTGLEAVCVVYDTKGVKASWPQSAFDGKPQAFAFDSRGTAYMRPIAINSADGYYTIALDNGDSGYVISSKSTTIAFWIVDYSEHRMSIDALSVSPDSDCSSVWLNVDGNAPRITYYTVTGRPLELDRRIKLQYHTLDYVPEKKSYTQITRNETYAHISTTVRADAPLCDTYFILSGDRFLAAWGESVSAESLQYTAVAVEAHTAAQQLESPSSPATLGGSAPVDVHFEAVASDAAVFGEWQFAQDPEFSDIGLSFMSPEVDYTFRDSGTTYVRYHAADASGICEWYSQVYTVEIGESWIKCPNAFSPSSSPGVNDTWRPVTRSIIDYDCHIFNRRGAEVAHLKAPEQGWDGRHRGRTVPSGTYYYVITARGADGRHYNLSGDINIIGPKSVESKY